MAQEGDLVLGSDGSADHAERATCAVTIMSKDLTTVHSSAYRVKGEHVDACRAEMYGLLALMFYITVIL